MASNETVCNKCGATTNDPISESEWVTIAWGEDTELPLCPDCKELPLRMLYGAYWDIQIGRNPWLSLGVHIDHTNPYIVFHLPGAQIVVGYIGTFIYRWSLRGCIQEWLS